MTDQKQNTHQRQAFDLAKFEQQWNRPFVGSLLPMLCLIETWALAFTCRSFLKYKRDFHKSFDDFMREKGIKPERIRYTMRHGLCVTGSTLHQILFNVRYQDSDINTLEMNISISTMRNTIPRSDELKEKKLKHWPEERKGVLTIQVINPHLEEDSECPYFKSEDIDSSIIFPVISNKHTILPPGSQEIEGQLMVIQKSDNGLEAVSRRIKELNLTTIELIAISPRICRSTLQFVDKFCDISSCKILYDGKLRIKHLDQLFTRTFEIFRDTKRYACRAVFGATREGRRMDDCARKIAKLKIENRYWKYTERGFTCLNSNKARKK
jgi:hypothetical protein